MPEEWTFAFVDLAGFTALTEAHGDLEAIGTVKAFRERVEALLAPGDRLVKTIGDAVMLAFPTPRAAVLLCTTAVALAARDLGHVVTHLGRVGLRNVAEPVDLYSVETETGHDTAIDPVCQMRVPRQGVQSVMLRWGDDEVWFCGLPCVARYAADPAAFTPAGSA